MAYAVNELAQMAALRTFRVLSACVLAVLVAGCPSEGGEGGDEVNERPLPLDSALNLYCPDVGIAGETCILDDPENPYARSVVNDTTKFELAADSPSAKSDFYLWGTAQARSPRGENQYFTALALHTLFTEGGSENAREQAKRAYRSVLDNYFGSVTFFSFSTPDGDLTLPQDLKQLVGENLYDPGSANLAQLYQNSDRALEALGEWGYVLDVDTGVVSRTF